MPDLARLRSDLAAFAADAPLRGEDGGLPTHDAAMVRLLADVLCRLDSIGAWLDGRWATDEGRPILEVERASCAGRPRSDAIGMSPR